MSQNDNLFNGVTAGRLYHISKICEKSLICFDSRVAVPINWFIENKLNREERRIILRDNELRNIVKHRVEFFGSY